jgi:hypothetical protein
VISRRSIVLWTLTTIPVLLYVVLAGYALWQTHVLSKIWWVGPAFWVLAWIIANLWKATSARAEQHPVEIATHWTPRDREAAKLVRGFQERVSQHTPAQLTDPQFYQAQVQEMAVSLARVYHPGASDAFASLTVPEVLAAVRLAVDDTEQWLLTAGFKMRPGSFRW